MFFLNVILPLPLPGTFTYRLPDDNLCTPQPGMRALVPFGKKKIYTAIVLTVSETAPTLPYTLRDVVCLLDEQPIATPEQLHLWQWMADYYMATLGDVYKAALPSALKIESETKVIINSDFVADAPLPAAQQRVLDALTDGKVHGVDQLARQLGVSNVMPQLNRLLSCGAVLVDEVLEPAYRPKTEACIALHPSIADKEQLQPFFDALSHAPKQQNVLMAYLELSAYLKTGVATEVPRKQILEKSGASSAILQALFAKKLFVQTLRQIDRLPSSEAPQRTAYALSEAQLTALQAIEEKWQKTPVTLLHGVTSSGKTEIYIRLIQKALEQGKQVLYLVPEIALTTQLTNRLAAVFGSQLGVYHSKFSDAERVEIYQNLLQHKSYQVVLGVRSAVFLPFSKLGLVIVDEEHETSYKQQNPAPRYHARNVAIVLAQMQGAKVLLGTATPAVESYHNALAGKYGLVELPVRYKNIALPVIRVVDIKEGYRKKQMTEHFADEVVTQMEAALQRNEQIILFQNRRGYAPYLECKSCGAVPRCPNCDVSLTVHRQHRALVCHYCGHTQPIPAKCPTCGSDAMADRGLGTERIEDEVKKLFPTARVARMDLDTTRARKSYQQIISDFEQRKTDVLVGTQMVSKGLDFENVSLVVVLNADNLFNQPDFRAYERAFQLLEQVSGRAGRAHGQGQVFLQTSQPENPIVAQVAAHNYTELYQSQITERQQFRYPPFFRLMQIVLKHRDSHVLDHAAALLAGRLQAVFGNRCSPVVVPVIGRVQNLHIRQLLLRVESSSPAQLAKCMLQEHVQSVLQDASCKGLLVYVDVDPA